MADEIRRWLEELSLGEYAKAFETNAIDNEVLKDLDDDDLFFRVGDACGHTAVELIRALAEETTEQFKSFLRPRELIRC